jgi:AcrR family transcriptional regulator
MATKGVSGFAFPSTYDEISDTQLQILQLSEFLLGTLGATGLELKSIATKLEVSPSLINHYYKTSEELIFDTVIYSYSRHIYGIQEKNKYVSDPEVVARSWIKETMTWTQSYPGIGVILEFPRQVLRSGTKRAEDPEKMLAHFVKIMSSHGVSNVAFMASAVRAIQKKKEFKVLAPAKVAALIASDAKYAMYTSMLGFATLGGGLWVAGRRPADKKSPFWMKLGFNPAKQMQNSIDEFIEVIKRGG